MNKREFDDFVSLLEEIHAECKYFQNLTKQLENTLKTIHPKSKVLKLIKKLNNEEN